MHPGTYEPIDESVYELELTHLAVTSPAALTKLRRSATLLRGGRHIAVGVGVDEAGTLYGFAAYAHQAAELDHPGFSARPYPLSFDDTFPATVEIEILYQGPSLDRALGTANYQLRSQAPTSKAWLDTHHVDHNLRLVEGRRAAANGPAFKRPVNRVSPLLR